MAVNPYDLTTHDGKRVDVLTHEALLEAERRLKYSLTVTQGSYNAGGVGASAGTHDGGGVVDLPPNDWRNKVRVLRSVGFAAWRRTSSEGDWPEHIHAVLIGNQKLSASAAQQVSAYRRGRNGLANNGRDPHPRPNPIPTFRWPPVSDQRSHVEKWRSLVNEARQEGFDAAKATTGARRWAVQTGNGMLAAALKAFPRK